MMARYYTQFFAAITISFILLFSVASGEDNEQYFPEDQFAVATALKSVLTKEVERDKETIAFEMNFTRLKQTRMAIKSKMDDRMMLAERANKLEVSAIERAIEIFNETGEDETKIIEEQRKSTRIRRNTYYTIKDNIPKKEKAIYILEQWLAGQ